MARNSLLTAITADEMLKILNDADYEQAYKLHKLAQEIGCKIEPRTGAHYYRIQYSTPKPKRSLFTIECNEKRWRVKANLYHLSSYQKVAENSSEKLKNSIKATRTCTGCNSRCIKGSKFKLDEKSYFTCIGSGHFFEDLDENAWNELKDLLKYENDIIIGVVSK